MCLIIYNKKGILTDKTILTSWENNPDGAGLMFVQSGEIKIMKELNNKTYFLELYKNLRAEFPQIKIALHFRIGTHGVKNLLNVHPFFVNENLAFMHNGIIDIKLPELSLVSDTVQFNESILKNLPANFLKNRAIKELIKSYIGYSKLLFMDSKNHVEILNSNLGNFDKHGNWFSNYSYIAETFIKPRKWYYEFDYCDYCNKRLISSTEIELGLCSHCFETQLGV